MIFQISITQVVRNVRSWQTSELIASCWGCQQTQLNLDNWLICFPTLRQPKTMSVFGEETKTSSNDLIVHFYHHPYLFVSEKKNKTKPLSTSNGLSHADLAFFGNRQAMVRSSTLLPFMPCWTVWGPGFGPRNPTSMWNCSTANPSNWKNTLQNWTALRTVHHIYINGQNPRNLLGMLQLDPCFTDKTSLRE